jgi:hypothetical protein
VKVKELILKLEKMPQHLDVGMVAFDQPDWSAGDWVNGVYHIIKSEYSDEEDPRMYKHLPSEYVVIHG